MGQSLTRTSHRFAVFSMLSRSQSSERVNCVAACTLLRSLLAKHAPAHVLVGPDAKIGALLRRFLPYSWFEAIIRRQFGLT
jgi:hypothetical protein